jgi:hypothetical protein
VYKKKGRIDKIRDPFNSVTSHLYIMRVFLTLNPHLKTSFLFYAGTESCELFQLLLSDDNINVNEQCATTGKIILHSIIEGYKKENAHTCEKNILLLLTHNTININHQDNNGKTPLHMALEYNQPAIIKILRQDPRTNKKISDHDGNTPLFMALIHKVHQDIVLSLIENISKNISIPNKNGDTLLHCARNEEIVRLLLLYEININTKNNQGETALHSSIIRPGSKPIIRCTGCTRCMHNKSCGEIYSYDKTITLINQPGININIHNNKGKTPLDYAIEKINPNHQEIIDLLVQRGAIQGSFLKKHFKKNHNIIKTYSLIGITILFCAGIFAYLHYYSTTY